MRLVLAPDKLKGSLPAAEAAAALARGLSRSPLRADVVLLPVADGGEGTLEALLGARGGERRALPVTGPLGERQRAEWGRLADGRAVLETAQAIGLARVARRDPLQATSRGAGQLVRAALEDGARRLLLGLGGSATVDGGAGLLQELGARLLDGAGRELAPGGGALLELERIDPAGLVDLRGVELVAACDVDNPLLGPTGAARVYGPQKGADPAAVERLERGLERLARALGRDLGLDAAALPGAGAAGGLGAALAALGARLERGAELVLDALELDRALRGADLVLTAEGALDATTLRGKATWAVLGRARRAGVPCLALAGRIDPAARERLLGPQGFAALLALPDGPLDEAGCLARAAELLEQAGETVGRLLGLGRPA